MMMKISTEKLLQYFQIIEISGKKKKDKRGLYAISDNKEKKRTKQNSV